MRMGVAADAAAADPADASFTARCDDETARREGLDRTGAVVGLQARAGGEAGDRDAVAAHADLVGLGGT